MSKLLLKYKTLKIAYIFILAVNFQFIFHYLKGSQIAVSLSEIEIIGFQTIQLLGTGKVI